MITPLYAGLLALLFIVLCVRVIKRRRSAKISIGDHGDNDLIKRQRVQANFVEYAPFGLLLIYMVEAQGLSAPLVHLLGMALVVGRVGHAYGLGSSPQKVVFRQAGMLLTFFAVAGAGLGNIWASLF